LFARTEQKSRIIAFCIRRAKGRITNTVKSQENEPRNLHQQYWWNSAIINT